MNTKLACFLGIFFWLTSSYFALAHSTSNEISDAIVIHPSEKIHDYGIVKDQSILSFEYTFRLTNTSARPIEIKSIQSSCGCTTATVPSKIIPSAGVMPVKTTLNLFQITGFKKATVRVEFQDKSHINLYLTATRPIKTRVFPSVLNVDTLNSQSANITFNIYKTQDTLLPFNQIHSLSVELPSIPFSYKFNCEEKLEPKKDFTNQFLTYTVNLSIPTLTARKENQVLLVKFQDGEVLTVPFHLNVKNPIRFEPEKVFAGKVKKGSVQNLELILKGAFKDNVTKMVVEGKDIEFKTNLGNDKEETKISLPIKWDLSPGFHQMNGHAILGDTNQTKVPFSVVGLIAE